MLNESNITTSDDVDNDIIMDDYNMLDFDKWMNHGKLFAHFNGSLIIPIPGRVRNKDLAPITLLCYKTIQGQSIVINLLSYYYIEVVAVFN